MNFKDLVFSSLILLVLLPACKPTQYSLSNPPENTISFGDGGGFAGIETGYTLLENGQLFRHNVPGDTVELEAIKKKEAASLYETFKGLRLQQLDIEQPGNLYYFIKFTTSEITHGITWGAADYELRSDIMNYYKSLRQLVKNRKEIVVDQPKKEKKEEKEKKEVSGW